MHENPTPTEQNNLSPLEATLRQLLTSGTGKLRISSLRMTHAILERDHPAFHLSGLTEIRALAEIYPNDIIVYMIQLIFS